MSEQKLVVPGFGVGTYYGTNLTRPLDSSSTVTLTGTVLPAGQYMVTGLVTGTSLKLASTTNGVTGTWVVLSNAPGGLAYDGSSGTLVSSTTSVSIIFIQT